MVWMSKNRWSLKMSLHGKVVKVILNDLFLSKVLLFRFCLSSYSLPNSVRMLCFVCCWRDLYLKLLFLSFLSPALVGLLHLLLSSGFIVPSFCPWWGIDVDIGVLFDDNTQLVKSSLRKALSRSECGFSYFACCREFHFSYLCLLSSFSFFFLPSLPPPQFFLRTIKVNHTGDELYFDPVEFSWLAGH